jgi:hypothetical protein
MNSQSFKVNVSRCFRYPNFKLIFPFLNPNKINTFRSLLTFLVYLAHKCLPASDLLNSSRVFVLVCTLTNFEHDREAIYTYESEVVTRTNSTFTLSYFR